MAAVALLLVSSTLEGTALRHFDWPNSGTCMGGPRDGKMVRDLKFCNFFWSRSEGTTHQRAPELTWQIAISSLL